MQHIIALLLSAIFTALSAIHIYWAFGGKWGAAAAIPTNEKGDAPLFNPGLFVTIIVALGLLAMGGFVLAKTGLLKVALPGWLNDYGLWVLVGIFVLRAIGDFKYIGFFKKVRNTRFGRLDTRFFAPLCLGIAFLGALLESFFN